MTASNIGNGPDKNFNAKEERKVMTKTFVLICNVRKLTKYSFYIVHCESVCVLCQRA